MIYKSCDKWYEKSKNTGFTGEYFEWLMDTCKYMYVCCDITATYLLCLYLCNHHKQEIYKNALHDNTNGKFTFILYWYLYVTAVSVPLSNNIFDIE
jgi:hypothetical protein